MTESVKFSAEKNFMLRQYKHFPDVSPAFSSFQIDTFLCVCFCWRTIKNRKGARLRAVLDELEATTALVLPPSFNT